MQRESKMQNVRGYVKREGQTGGWRQKAGKRRRHKRPKHTCRQVAPEKQTN